MEFRKMVTMTLYQFTQSCPTPCDPMNRSTPGLPVHHQLPESTQTHVHWVRVANILLYFPNGETKYASDNHLSRFVWFFSGILGGGLLVSRSEIITALKKISFLLDEMFSWKVFYKACFQIQDFCSFLFWKLIKDVEIGIGYSFY